MQDKAKALNGENNRRLDLKLALDRAINAPFADAYNVYSETNVNIPSEENTLQAKDWVDNGSRT